LPRRHRFEAANDMRYPEENDEEAKSQRPASRASR